jgi:chromosome segregation ATPase
MTLPEPGGFLPRRLRVRSSEDRNLVHFFKEQVMSCISKSAAQFQNARLQGEAILAQTRKPYEGAIADAERNLEFCKLALSRAEANYESSCTALKALQQANSVAVHAASALLGDALKQNEESVRLNKQALEAAQQAVKAAEQSLAETNRPIQPLLDLCAAIGKGLLLLDGEDKAVCKRIEDFEASERRHQEAWERQRNACRSCNDAPGGCRDCDPTR